MSRRNNSRSAASSQGEGNGPTVVIDKKLYDLLKEGKITSVLTWRRFDQKPDTIAVTSQQEDPINLRVKGMQTVFHGYLPEGYPAGYASKGTSTRFIVEPVEPSTEEKDSANE